jgi:hypothetical protein
MATISAWCKKPTLKAKALATGLRFDVSNGIRL